MTNANHYSATSANAVREAMEAAGITVRQLADRAGMRQTTLGRNLADDGSFTVGQLDRIAAALGVEVSTLVAP